MQSDRSTNVQLNFHRVGGVNIGINFDDCSCDQYGVCTVVDDAGNTSSCQPAGLDGGVLGDSSDPAG